MIFRRIAKSLRNQHWTTFWIEFVLLVIGVFLGMQVSNWNEKRLDRLETQELLQQLQPELQQFIRFFDSTRNYYATTGKYAKVAFAGWEGRPEVTDKQFVIAAYQASQIQGFGGNMENWAFIFGGDQIRNIADTDIRRGLSALMTSDHSLVSTAPVSTRYREDVRRIIPDPVQEAIRKQCGDKPAPPTTGGNVLSPTCELRLSAAQAKGVADKLRANPQLADDLRWHQAAVATFLSNADNLQSQIRDLSEKLEASN